MRKPRQYSSTGFYHNIVRGVNKMNIFLNSYKFVLYFYNLQHLYKLLLNLRNSDLVLFLKNLFEKIKDKVKELLQQAKEKVGYSAKFIFMVGGFSESPYLKTEIKKTFESEDITVLAPKRPQVSVIRGACMFGLNPRSITSRIAKKTYGINTLELNYWTGAGHIPGFKIKYGGVRDDGTIDVSNYDAMAFELTCTGRENPGFMQEGTTYCELTIID